MSALGKIALLLTSKANQAYAGQISTNVWKYLCANETAIKNELGVLPKGYILVTDNHPSSSDPKTHFTVDAYDKDANDVDKPIGCIHVYEDLKSHKVFEAPRAKALKAYKAKTTSS